MKILVACEESQAVCKAFRERGHEAYSCDIIDCSGGHPEWHIQGDVIPLLNGKCIFKTCDGAEHIITGKWDMIIAFPPCTYLSNAGACRLFKKFEGKSYCELERLNKGFDAKEFFMTFLNADADKIAVENPIPSRVYRLPNYTQTIQPTNTDIHIARKLVYGLKDYLNSFQPILSNPWGLMYAGIRKYGNDKLQMEKFTEKKKAQNIEAKHSPA